MNTLGMSLDEFAAEIAKGAEADRLRRVYDAEREVLRMCVEWAYGAPADGEEAGIAESNLLTAIDDLQLARGEKLD
jgi:hypothetical protein